MESGLSSRKPLLPTVRQRLPDLPCVYILTALIAYLAQFADCIGKLFSVFETFINAGKTDIGHIV